MMLTQEASEVAECITRGRGQAAPWCRILSSRAKHRIGDAPDCGRWYNKTRPGSAWPWRRDDGNQGQGADDRPDPTRGRVRADGRCDINRYRLHRNRLCRPGPPPLEPGVAA